MPEGPEIKITSEFININADFKTFSHVTKSDVHKGKPIEDTNFVMRAIPRGKELFIAFYKEDYQIKYRFTMGMTGHFEVTKPGEIFPKHSHLQFHSDDRILHFVDSRRFGKWVQTEDSKRGPDSFDNFTDFVINVQSNVNNPKYQDYAMLDLVLSQKLFNGIGNYLRAELFHHADVNPFKKFKDLTPRELEKIVCCAQTVQHISYFLGGGQLMDWKNPFKIEKLKFNDWIKVYRKAKKIKDKTKRTFWFEEKWKETQEYVDYVNKFGSNLVKH